MRILAFVDTHGSISALKRIVSESKKADIVICAGDISEMQINLEKLISLISASKTPVLIIHGNHEDPENLKRVCSRFESVIFLHKKEYIFDDCIFLGYGGGGFALRERDFRETAKGFSEIIRRNPKKKIILITHAPPRGTRLDLLGREHRGNSDIREFMEKNRIKLLVCGHFHENFGVKDKIGNKILINPGHGRIINV
ncbi:MAG: metallophosphoesterase family protein [Candidatus Woesearchaeota archaeon]|nr:metallophosphoesterase family protein [Candidatus Woesearchaeota archaeon]